MSKPNFDLIEELRWRGLIQDMIPGTDEHLAKEITTGYVGFDPTAESLHVGSLVPILLLMHMQKAGHKPVALVGGATGMIGDPSMKSEERKLLNEEQLERNVNGIRKQLSKFINFDDASGNGAVLVNNYDWFKDISFINFLRDAGKHISVNYMMAKDSVKKRLEGDSGISYTEFAYQLMQGYDFFHLYTTMNVKLQFGGSDQWGNITTGTEFIRRKAGGSAFAFTSPLIKKSDGVKFGKTEKGNVWLDASLTSPYEFYQFWLNAADDDAENWIKIFTFLPKTEIENLIAQHREAPHTRILQKRLAEEVTTLVHSAEALNTAIAASEILFGKGTFESLQALSADEIASIFKGVPQYEISKEDLNAGLSVVDLLAEKTTVFPSKSEARRMLKSNGVSINKNKVGEEHLASVNDLLKDQFILVQKGKKDYHLINVR